MTVFYDENCNLCQFMKRLFHRVKRGNPKTVWKHYEQAPACGINDHQCGEAMTVELENGATYRGFFAVRVLMRYTWVFFLVPLLHLPGMNKFGPKLYGWVARNRHRW
ncbi:thiol-disulfide oxidoreductase DCC family protein [Brevibacillus ginsengisoli]|uniref:thiol-disulfide oxidoreductase DCC family protein n=1 Tax=Brevibacillus ginsengisoli TaxID=363854 RepID=UPI003CF6243A